MRRSICISEPQTARAGDIFTWQFRYTTSTALPAGATLKFDLRSFGRDIDWETPSSDLDKDSNVIYAITGTDEVLQAKEVEAPDSIVPQYEFTLTTPPQSGQRVSNSDRRTS